MDVSFDFSHRNIGPLLLLPEIGYFVATSEIKKVISSTQKRHFDIDVLGFLKFAYAFYIFHVITRFAKEIISYSN